MLLRFAHVEEDLRLVLRLLGLPAHLPFSLGLKNDPVRGPHNYLAALTPPIALAIEKYYGLDFRAFGFPRLGDAPAPEAAPAPPAWVARACVPVTADGAAPPGTSFNWSAWTAPLACRGIEHSLTVRTF